MSRILLLSGPNLNMLGLREPEIYGAQTLSDIEQLCREETDRVGAVLDCRQSNSEGELVTWLQQEMGKVDGIAINAGAYTHTSIAIHDALKLHDVPIMEVHVSNPKERESFRHISYIEPLSTKVFAGYGGQSYVLAIKELLNILEKKNA